MRYLIKKAKIVTPEKTSQRRDILIEKGVITQIAKSIEDSRAKEISSTNLHVSAGFLDIGTFIGEPGYEERETLEHVSEAARKGGYTHLAPFPNLQPTTDNKSAVRFLKEAFLDQKVNIHPIGAVSKSIKGENIAEMIDMHEYGAIAFSDGIKSIQDTGLLLRALEYVKTFDGIIIQQPRDNALQSTHMIHESPTSVSLGLPGIPPEAETIMLKRDLDLVNYTDSKICVHNISSKQAYGILKKSKKRIDDGKVFATVPVMNVIHTVKELEQFNPAYKVIPPLRSEEDRKGLIKGLKMGVLDAISSNHRPVDPEHKDLEFFRSSFGASTLDTCFSSLLTYTIDELGINVIIDKLAHGPRRILGLRPNKIAEGERADLCIFDPSLDFEVSSSNIQSKSKNNPYIGRKLKGRVLGTILGDHISLT